MTVIIEMPERRKGLRFMPDVTKETFQGYSVDSKLNTLFDYQLEATGLLGRTCDRVDKVENNMKRWKLVSGSVAIGSGFLGGAAAMLAKLAFWK